MMAASIQLFNQPIPNPAPPAAPDSWIPAFIDEYGLFVCAVLVLCLLAGMTLLYLGLFRDRSRGRRRCPKCWFNLDQHAPDESGSVTCPECGFAIRKDRATQRTRRHWRLAVIGILLTSTFFVTPAVLDLGWRRFVPMVILLQAEPGTGLDAIRGGLGNPGPSNEVLDEIQRRIDDEAMSDAAWNAVLSDAQRALEEDVLIRITPEIRALHEKVRTTIVPMDDGVVTHTELGEIDGIELDSPAPYLNFAIRLQGEPMTLEEAVRTIVVGPEFPFTHSRLGLPFPLVYQGDLSLGFRQGTQHLAIHDLESLRELIASCAASDLPVEYVTVEEPIGNTLLSSNAFGAPPTRPTPSMEDTDDPGIVGLRWIMDLCSSRIGNAKLYGDRWLVIENDGRELLLIEEYFEHFESALRDPESGPVEQRIRDMAATLEEFRSVTLDLPDRLTIDEYFQVLAKACPIGLILPSRHARYTIDYAPDARIETQHIDNLAELLQSLDAYALRGHPWDFSFDRLCIGQMVKREAIMHGYSTNRVRPLLPRVDAETGKALAAWDQETVDETCWQLMDFAYPDGSPWLFTRAAVINITVLGDVTILHAPMRVHLRFRDLTDRMARLRAGDDSAERAQRQQWRDSHNPQFRETGMWTISATHAESIEARARQIFEASHDEEKSKKGHFAVFNDLLMVHSSRDVLHAIDRVIDEFDSADEGAN